MKRCQLKRWMVEARIKLPNGFVTPVRAIVMAHSRKVAKASANKAVDCANERLAKKHNLATVPERITEAIVLYPI